MKEYILWLESGEAPVGQMEDDEAQRLSKAFQEQRPGVSEFADTDGTLFVNMQRVVALAINDLPEKDPAGFTKTQTC